MNEPERFAGVSRGNSRYLTRKLWGDARGCRSFSRQFTTMRQAVLAHAGEALESRHAFEALTKYGRMTVIGVF